jgi:CMP-N-acetylneuraminic acid synthetase
MFKKKSILAIIPARLGSKGIKNKNLKKIGSLSLIEIAIKNAEKSKYLDKIVVTSDDPKILKLKIKYKKVIFIKEELFLLLSIQI